MERITHTNFNTIEGISHLFSLLRKYHALEIEMNTFIPDPESNTYLAEIVALHALLINKATELP